MVLILMWDSCITARSFQDEPHCLKLVGLASRRRFALDGTSLDEL